MLVDVYKTTPQSLLNARFEDFEAAEWRALAVHLDEEPFRAVYDWRVIHHILTLIGTTKVWFETTLAQRFLCSAIIQEDVPTIDFILSTFEHARANNRFREDETYLEMAVDHITAGNDLDYSVLKRLVRDFRDSGTALFSAVRYGNADVVGILLPHSDASYNFCLAYRWAQVHNFHAIETLLDPHSDKIRALFGYINSPWSDDADQSIAHKRKTVLAQNIENNVYDEPLARLYRKGLQQTLETDDFLQWGGSEVYILARLWNTTHVSNAYTALRSVEFFDDELAHELIKHFRHVPDIVLPRLSSIAQQRLLNTCAWNGDRPLADLIYAHGVDVNKTYQRLVQPSGIEKMANVPAVARTLQKRVAARALLERWISEWQAQNILHEIDGGGASSAPSKL